MASLTRWIIKTRLHVFGKLFMTIATIRRWRTMSKTSTKWALWESNTSSRTHYCAEVSIMWQWSWFHSATLSTQSLAHISRAQETKESTSPWLQKTAVKKKRGLYQAQFPRATRKSSKGQGVQTYRNLCHLRQIKRRGKFLRLRISDQTQDLQCPLVQEATTMTRTTPIFTTKLLDWSQPDQTTSSSLRCSISPQSNK